MAEEKQHKAKSDKVSKIDIRNDGEPLRFKNVEPLAGFSAEPGKGGEQINVWTRMALTSDEPLFHRLVKNLAGVISYMAQRAGTPVNLQRVGTVLLILKPDNSAELWLDTAAVSLKCSVKRSMKAGTVVFEKDIADITGMCFPCVDFGKEDKVLCIFRLDWRFGFAFDMNPEGKLDIEGFNKNLGTLYRNIRYKHLYDALGETKIFNRLLAIGWFPFIEIINDDFQDILNHCKAGFDLNEVERKVISRFNASRLDGILKRWLSKPHFKTKSDLLTEAINAFKDSKPIPVIKILLTEIEGILNDAHQAAHGGQGAKLEKLLKFAATSAARKAGGADSLLLPEAFGRYLREYTFASFNPKTQKGVASSRHAVGHGKAVQESYTIARALQAILTLDQIAFYT